MKGSLAIAVMLLYFDAGLFAQQPETRTYAAHVIDRSNTDPIPFAKVQLEGSPVYALTNEVGFFALELSPSRSNEKRFLVINYVGYQPMRFPIPRRVTRGVRTVKLRRVKFDLSDPPVIRNGRDR